MDCVQRSPQGVTVTDSSGHSAQVGRLGRLSPIADRLQTSDYSSCLMFRACLLPLPQFDELVFACGAEEAKRMLGQGATR